MKSLSLIENKVEFLNGFIQYLNKTDADNWCTDICRDPKGRNCLIGHLVDYMEFPDHGIKMNNLIDVFEYEIASTYAVFAVNDKRNDNYQQPTIKERCIAFMENIMNGKEKTTKEWMDSYTPPID